MVIPTVDLLSAGLLPGEPDREGSGNVSRGQGTGQEPGQSTGNPPDLVALLGETIRALQAAEAEAGRLRGLLESAETKERQERAATDTAHAEVLALRARVQELEAVQAEPSPGASEDSRETWPWWRRMLGA